MELATSLLSVAPLDVTFGSNPIVACQWVLISSERAPRCAAKTESVMSRRLCVLFVIVYV